MSFDDIVKAKTEFDKTLRKFNPRFRSQIEIKVNDKTYYFMGQSQEYIEKILSEVYSKTFIDELNKVDFDFSLSTDNYCPTFPISFAGDVYRVAFRLLIEE